MGYMGQFPVRSPEDPPIKRLVICCDGTWQSSNHGIKSIPSNVAKMANAVTAWSKDAKGKPCPQIVYYDSGVGTAQGFIDSAWSGGSGAGLAENVCEAYNFLVQNYTPGDELYLFGFSRGAFTVRSIAGLVADLGICTPLMMEQFWDIYAHYKEQQINFDTHDFTEGSTSTNLTGDAKKKQEHDHEEHKNWLARCYRNVDIKVVGVWDTVGSLGWPSLNFPDVSAWNKKYSFHNVEVSPRVQNAFHALALDEHRKPFGPTLWELPHDSKNDPTNLVQCWFPGVHINSGGGSGDGIKEQKGDLEALANVTFAWMVDRVQETTNLEFSFVSLERTVDKYISSLRREGFFNEKPTSPGITWNWFGKTVPTAKEANILNDPETRNAWGLGTILDSCDWKAKRVASQVRTPGECTKLVNGKEHKLEVRFTNETIHPIVAHRREAVALKLIEETNFDPKALADFEREPVGDNKGYIWKRSEKTVPGILYGQTVVPEIIIPEFQISKTLDLEDKRSGLIQGRKKLSMERLLIILGEYPEKRKPKDLGAARELVQLFNKDATLSKAGRFLVQLDKDYENAPLQLILNQDHTTQDYVAIPRKNYGDAPAGSKPVGDPVPVFYRVAEKPRTYKEVMQAFDINNY